MGLSDGGSNADGDCVRDVANDGNVVGPTDHSSSTGLNEGTSLGVCVAVGNVGDGVKLMGDASDEGATLNVNALGPADDCLVVGDGEEEGTALMGAMLGIATGARDGEKLAFGIGVVGAAALGATEDDPACGALDESVSVVDALVDIADGVGEGSVVESGDDAEDEGATLISAALAGASD